MDNDEHLILLPDYMTLDLFLKNARVKKDRYLGRTLQKIYMSLTVPKIDLFEEYELFYRLEYDSFSMFLYKKYPILTDDDLNKINLVLEDPKYSIYRGFFKKHSDYNVISLLEHQEGLLDKVTSYLNRQANED
ncbi:MAG: hypothetical protein HWN69_03040 [Desulfobacterales bacterium]|nr:hypothetical protein [Desulfobacterales bacterium]